MGKRNQIEYNGVTYDSLRQFSVENKLVNYNRIREAWNNGATPDDLIKEFSQRKRRTYNLINFHGKIYYSFSEAATDIGSSPAYAFIVRKKLNLSDEETLEYLSSRINAGIGNGRKKKVVVDGVEYESEKAAARAYNLSTATINSRMRRDGLTFGEAVLYADNYRRGIPLSQESLDVTKLTVVENPKLTVSQKNVCNIIKDAYGTALLLSDGKRLSAVKFPISTGNQSILDCYILLTDAPTYTIVIPALIPNVPESMEVYQSINEFNSTMMGSVIWYKNGNIGAFWTFEQDMLRVNAYQSFEKIVNIFKESCLRFLKNIHKKQATLANQ